VSVHKATPPGSHPGERSIDDCAVCGETIHKVPGGHGMTWVHDSTGAVAGFLPDDEANGDGKAASYVPTHRSKLDGSEAMQVGTLSALVLRNENGDEWVDNVHEWEAL
jgi:hypothetical protein